MSTSKSRVSKLREEGRRREIWSCKTRDFFTGSVRQGGVPEFVEDTFGGESLLKAIDSDIAYLSSV